MDSQKKIKISDFTKSILMLGCFDTKGEDFFYLQKCIKDCGESIITMNTGVMGTTENFIVDFESDVVASEGGSSILKLRKKGDRGAAIEVMGIGAAKITAKLIEDGRIKGVISMGGGGGTYIALSAMQVVPLTIPKLCLSTLATKDLSRQIKNKNITLMPSVVDVAGLNSISRLLINQAAQAICGMAKVRQDTRDRDSRGRIAISMFGNTTACVNMCSDILTAKGYEVFTFHANGEGGRTMEDLIREGYFDGVLDVTTTELVDELCGGVCSSGPERLTAAAESGIIQVVVPGCLDMANFAQRDSVPERYEGRYFYNWAPDVTLMRTNREENQKLGKTLATKVNVSTAPTSILLPTKGLSQLDAKGEIFYRPEINEVLFEEIKKNVKDEVKVVEVNAHINDETFSIRLVNELLSWMECLK